MVTPKDFYPRLITAFFLAAGFIISYFFAPLLLSLLFAASLGIILVYEWPTIGIWWLTPLYPVMPFILLILLNHSSERRLILFIVILCALFDTAGYFIGSAFGNHKLIPSLSPKKSWEGLLAGVSAVFICAPFLMHGLHLSTPTDLYYYIFITEFCFLTLMGDLLVSYFKRTTGVKDTSNLLPGHGGLLDRLDSVLLTTMLVYASKSYLVQ